MEDFETALTNLLNKFSRENNSNTPDCILADYLINCLEAFELAAVARDASYE